MTARDIQAWLDMPRRPVLEPSPDEMPAATSYYFEAKALGFSGRDAIRYAWLRVDSERRWEVAA